jgi:hypothetical protein
MNAHDHLDPLPFNDPDSSPDSQVAIGMVLDLRRDMERQESFWRWFAVAALGILTIFGFTVWSSGLLMVDDIRQDIKSQVSTISDKDHQRIIILEKEILRLEALAGVEPSQDLR